MLNDPRLAYCPLCDAAQIVPVDAANYTCPCGMDWETPFGRLARLKREGWHPRVPPQAVPAWERVFVVVVVVAAIAAAVAVVVRDL